MLLTQVTPQNAVIIHVYESCGLRTCHENVVISHHFICKGATHYVSTLTAEVRMFLKCCTGSSIDDTDFISSYIVQIAQQSYILSMLLIQVSN